MPTTTTKFFGLASSVLHGPELEAILNEDEIAINGHTRCEIHVNDEASRMAFCRALSQPNEYPGSLWFLERIPTHIGRSFKIWNRLALASSVTLSTADLKVGDYVRVKNHRYHCGVALHSLIGRVENLVKLAEILVAIQLPGQGSPLYCTLFISDVERHTAGS